MISQNCKDRNTIKEERFAHLPQACYPEANPGATMAQRLKLWASDYTMLSSRYLCWIKVCDKSTNVNSYSLISLTLSLWGKWR